MEKKSIILMGNGPSLNKVDINLLKNIDTFSFNGALMSYGDWNFSPTYYSIIDGNSLRSLAPDIKELIKNNKEIKRFFLNDSEKIYNFRDIDDDRVSSFTKFDSRMKFNGWNDDIPKIITNIPILYSVTAFSIQLAIQLGYTNIGLVGVDARYVKRPDVKVIKEDKGHYKGQDKVIFTSDNDPSFITAAANDFGYEKIFHRFVHLYAEKGDILIGISSSGMSDNVIDAGKLAKTKGCGVITFSGFKSDNKLRKVGDINFWVDSESYNQVESIHNNWLVTIGDLIIKDELDKIGLHGLEF
jgi:hypothetical protein